MFRINGQRLTNNSHYFINTDVIKKAPMCVTRDKLNKDSGSKPVNIFVCEPVDENMNLLFEKYVLSRNPLFFHSIKVFEFGELKPLNETANFASSDLNQICKFTDEYEDLTSKVVQYFDKRLYRFIDQPHRNMDNIRLDDVDVFFMNLQFTAEKTKYSHLLIIIV